MDLERLSASKETYFDREDELAARETHRYLQMPKVSLATSQPPVLAPLQVRVLVFSGNAQTLFSGREELRDRLNQAPKKTMWGLRVTTKTLARAHKSSSRAFHQTAAARFAITTVNVPSMGDSISEGTLVQIVKAVGEAVHADEVVAILETDKVSVDVMSPVAGTIVEHLAKLEENVEVGRALFSVDDSRAPEPGSKPSSQSKGVVPAAAAPPAPTPAPAAASSSAADASGHRTPLIKFLGKRSLLPAKSASPVQPAARSLTPLAPVQPSGPDVLPFNHVKRVPLTPAEVAAINSGVSFL